MSLKEHTSHEDIKELVRVVTANGSLPFNANLINCAHYVTDDGWSTTSLRFFSFPADNPIYVFLVELSDLQFPFVFIRPPHAGNDSSLLSTALHLLLEKIDAHIKRYGRFLLETDDDTKNLAVEFLKASRRCTVEDEEKQSALLPFFMDEQQSKELIATSLDLPPGYVYSSANLDGDLKKIHSIWNFGSVVDIGVNRDRVQSLPHSCVKTTSGELAGWELSHPFGWVYHLYVLEEHRGRGLGPLTELKLMQDYAKRGMIPVKFIDADNDLVNRGTFRSPLWTQWKYSDGRPVRWTYTVIARS